MKQTLILWQNLSQAALYTIHILIPWKVVEWIVGADMWKEDGWRIHNRLSFIPGYKFYTRHWSLFDIQIALPPCLKNRWKHQWQDVKLCSDVTVPPQGGIKDPNCSSQAPNYKTKHESMEIHSAEPVSSLALLMEHWYGWEVACRNVSDLRATTLDRLYPAWLMALPWPHGWRTFQFISPSFIL